VPRRGPEAGVHRGVKLIFQNLGVNVIGSCAFLQSRNKKTLEEIVKRIITLSSLSGRLNRYLYLLDSAPLPEHGTDIAPHHFSKAEQEPFLDTKGELVFRDRSKTKRLVK